MKPPPEESLFWGCQFAELPEKKWANNLARTEQKRRSGKMGLLTAELQGLVCA